MRASQPEPTTTSLNFTASITSGDNDSERHGFGFHKDSTTKYGDIKEEDYPGSVETSLDKTTIQNERKEGEINETGIYLFKVVTRPISRSKIEPVVITAKETEAEDNKELKEFTDIVMEKIKFLSEGSQNLSAIQIMVIQLQVRTVYINFSLCLSLFFFLFPLYLIHYLHGKIFVFVLLDFGQRLGSRGLEGKLLV